MHTRVEQGLDMQMIPCIADPEDSLKFNSFILRPLTFQKANDKCIMCSAECGDLSGNLQGKLIAANL